MLHYLYDGSFEGLLTAVHEAYYRGDRPQGIICRQNLQYNLLDEYIAIETDEAKSDKVYRSICEKISWEALQHVYHVFLAEAPDAGTLIYNYLKLGWRMGSKVDFHLSDDRVLNIHKISQRVDLERHKLMGFVRFRQVVGGIFYAPIGPDNNIVELLAPHFAERLSDQNWIIHDVNRELAALYNKKDWVIADFNVGELPAATQEESKYQELWKEFFNTLAIPSRNNPKLQKQLMPRRYWKHLTEKW